MANLTTSQIENIQSDFGVLTLDLGESSERVIAPVRGGVTFTVTKTLRNIEHDYAKGSEKGLQVVDDIDAMLSCNSLEASIDNLESLMPYTVKSGTGTVADPYTLTCTKATLGLIADSKYHTNIAFVGQTLDGKDIIIKLFNAMNESDFTITAQPKNEGEIGIEIHAHFDPTDDTATLFEVIKEGTD